MADGPSNRLIHREDPAGVQPPNLVLLDTPDVDGAIPVNWDRARLIAHSADVLIAILTQQKFNDAAVRRFFREAAEADKTVVVVFNMVEWPEDHEHCLRWLETFCKGTGAAPAHVYAVPRDRAAVRENRLEFHPLSPGSTEPRRDLAELRFTEIKVRSLRGALRQTLEPEGGLPAYLEVLKARPRRIARPGRSSTTPSRSSSRPPSSPATSSPARSGAGWSRGAPGSTGPCTGSTARSAGP